MVLPQVTKEKSGISTTSEFTTTASIAHSISPKMANALEPIIIIPSFCCRISLTLTATIGDAPLIYTRAHTPSERHRRFVLDLRPSCDSSLRLLRRARVSDGYLLAGSLLRPSENADDRPSQPSKFPPRAGERRRLVATSHHSFRGALPPAPGRSNADSPVAEHHASHGGCRHRPRRRVSALPDPSTRPPGPTASSARMNREAHPFPAQFYPGFAGPACSRTAGMVCSARA